MRVLEAKLCFIHLQALEKPSLPDSEFLSILTSHSFQLII